MSKAEGFEGLGFWGFRVVGLRGLRLRVEGSGL